MGRWVFGVALLLFPSLLGCPGRERPVEPPPICLDDDGDGFGVGTPCAGFDCNEGDPDAHECDCSGDGVRFGCPCLVGDVRACFDGPPELAGVGVCQGGLRQCEGGYWSVCQGQGQPQAEVCDLLDNDCDGRVDEDVSDACSDCTSGCELLGFGPGYAHPFEAEGAGLSLTAQGSLTLTGESRGPRLAWIPNTLEGTISKVDTREHTELGRYRTGPHGPSRLFDGGEGDLPAAVAVTPDGDAIVANRAPHWTPSVTRIRNEGCPPGPDGVVDTSTGGDVLAWVSEGPLDDCIAWHTEAGPATSIGRAVVWQLRPELDQSEHDFVWFAAGRQLIELFGLTGEPTGRTVDLDRAPSSATIDPDGWIWLAEPGGRSLLRVDTISLAAEAIAVPPDEWAHDVAADARGGIWTSGSHILRYDPTRLSWELAAGSTEASGMIVVDPKGVGWTIDDGGDVQRAEDLGGGLTTDVVATGIGGTGIAVDHDGLIWSVGLVDRGIVTVIEPALNGRVAGTFCDFLTSSYARGDLTGAPRFDGLAPVVWSGRVDDPARDCNIDWRGLDVRGTIGSDVGLRVEVRAAASPEGLELAAWIVVAEVPDEALPVDIGTLLDAALQFGPMLDVRLTITPVDRDELPVIDAVTVERIEFCL